jgi:hypothetical protein
MSTGAGKGSLPRHVDGESFRSNYDRIFSRKSSATPKDDKPKEAETATPEPPSVQDDRSQTG